MDRADSIIGESHAVGVAAEVIENMVGRSKGFFGVGDPRFMPQRFNSGTPEHVADVRPILEEAASFSETCSLGPGREPGLCCELCDLLLVSPQHRVGRLGEW